MRIVRVSVWKVDLPLSAPYFLSGGRLRFDRLDSTFVRIETDCGRVGWGEGCPWGHTYLPAHGSGTRAALEVLAPAILGLDPRALDHLNRVMDVTLPGHPYAKSPIDVACWDIAGQAAELPLWKLMGASAAAPVAVNSSISTGTPDEMIDLIKSARAKGYRTHSAKLGGSNAAVDIARINGISTALQDDELVTFDINRAWTPGVAIRVLNAVSDRSWVEQPCETMEQCAEVAAKVAQPVLLDECLHSFDHHLLAWSSRQFAGLKIKPNRIGGLTRARQVRDFAVSVGWQAHIEDVGGSALADTAALHLAASTPEENRMASWLSHDHLAVDPVDGQGVRNVGGFATPSDRAGLGVIPDDGALGKPFAVYET